MPPRIALNMMVLNGAAVLPRCLRSVRGAVDELVVIDTGSTDDTQAVVTAMAEELGVDRLYYERLHPLGPEFFSDEASTFRTALPGPFTGKRLPRDWAAVRNLALANTTADYVLKLDADDEALCPPSHWRQTAECLEERPATQVIAAPYEVMDGHGRAEWLSMYDRLWRRQPKDGSAPLRWTMACHEYLAGKGPDSVLHNVQGLRVRDWRDSPGDGVRVPHRNLKVLLHDWEQGDRKTISEPEDLAADLVMRFTLAHEAVEVLPWLADSLLDRVLGNVDASDTAMRADCHYHMGRIFQARYAAKRQRDDFRAAEHRYKTADEVRPHLQALLCLGRLYEQDRDESAVRKVAEEVVRRVGSLPPGAQVYNCDLKLLAELIQGASSRVLFASAGTFGQESPGGGGS